MSKAWITSFFHCVGFEQRMEQNISNLVMPIFVPIRVLNSFDVPFIPTAFSFAIGIGVSGLSYENENILVYKFIDPSGKTIIEQEGSLKLPSDSKAFEGTMLNIQLQNVILSEEGLYASKFFFNDELLGEYPIRVKIVKAEG